MIILDEKYVIVAGDNSFNLAVKMKVKEEEKYVSQTYHSSILSALQYYIKLKQKEKVNSKVYKNITEAIEDLKKLDADIRKKINL